MQNERLLSLKKPGCFLQAAAGIEQDFFARNLDPNPEIVVLLKELDHLIREVVHIYDDLANFKGDQAPKRNLQHRLPSDFHQRLRTIISERSQPRTETSSQNHCPHRLAFSASAFSNAILSSSRCTTTTSTPLRPRNRFATCSARYTERCWPPVQPNDTIKFLKPRRW